MSLSSYLILLSRRSAAFAPLSSKRIVVGPRAAAASSWSSSSTSLPSSKTTGDGSALSKSRTPFRAPKTSSNDASFPTVATDASSSYEYSWNKLGLTSDLVTALEDNLRLRHPTPIQQMAIPAIMSGYSRLKATATAADDDDDDDATTHFQSVAFAAATGSGKTLAYLLPLIQSLKSDELLTPDDNALSKLRRPRRPRALILAPTRELATQILSVVKSLSHSCKISSEGLIGGTDAGSQRKRLEHRPVDVLVATPGRLVKHRDAGHVFLGSVKHVVIDEVDTMLEQGFQADVCSVLHPMLYKKRGDYALDGSEALVPGAPQVILTTATMTNAVRRLLGLPVTNKKRQMVTSDEAKKYTIHLPPNVRLLEAPGLHRAVPTLRQTFVDVGQTDKLTLLLDVVQSASYNSAAKTKTPRLTMVFCNTIQSCRAAEHALVEAGIPSLCYHGEINSTDRANNLNTFRNRGKVDTATGGGGGGGEGAAVLVATDIAARGLDVPEVDHVVMFDFPLNPIDYLHRAGRTARASSSGGEGRVTALVA
eukprot:CAMPEP_0172500588 /NCGR_PEP_ID=MMETSP1066-20121228/140448_1 /TAXON_ID=671091 /ORGANISM="Coscinodiscus wailesii, Strain CCMP2513" /LENGTH=536 /DNA_ID=CAMNT_0013274903 /DNA_START=194 /DNA_END=1801 /DNA_ORIENTATION=-